MKLQAIQKPDSISWKWLIKECFP